MKWLILIGAMGIYSLCTWIGWRADCLLQRRQQWQHQIMLFTCGIWLSLSLLQLLPSAEQTFVGVLGFVKGHILSAILFFTPLFLMGAFTTLSERQIIQRGWSLHFVMFCIQNVLEGILIYVLYQTNSLVAVLYVLFTAPHAIAEVMSIRYMIVRYNAPRHHPLYLYLIVANYVGLGIGALMVTFMGSLIGLSILHVIFSGYLCYVCLVVLYQQVILATGKAHVPYALFMGLLLMAVLNILI